MIIMMIIAVPRSCPSATSPMMRTPAGTSNGTTACLHWWSRACLRDRTAAAQTISAGLGELGWLHGEPTEAQPVPIAVHGHAQGREHQAKGYDGGTQKRPGELADVPGLGRRAKTNMMAIPALPSTWPASAEGRTDSFRPPPTPLRTPRQPRSGRVLPEPARPPNDRPGAVPGLITEPASDAEQEIAAPRHTARRKLRGHLLITVFILGRPCSGPFREGETHRGEIIRPGRQDLVLCRR